MDGVGGLTELNDKGSIARCTTLPAFITGLAWAGPQPDGTVRERTVITIFDGSRQRLVRVLTNGQCNESKRLGLAGDVVGAVGVGNDWIVAVVSPSGITHLVRVTNIASGRVRCDTLRGSKDADVFASAARNTLLSPLRGGLSITDMRWPFVTQLVSESGKVRKQLRPFVVDTTLGVGSDTVRASSLVSMPLQELAEGFLQVLTDVRSDQRALILYNATGQRVRQTMVGVALGPLSSSIDRGELLMTRRTDTVHVIKYKVRWMASRENLTPTGKQ